MKSNDANFSQGFATNPTESAYPRLWQGLVGMWCPSIGKQGAKLYDLSGYKRNASFVVIDPATDYVSGNYGYALRYDGASDYLNIGEITHLNDATKDVSIAFWIKTTNTSNQGLFSYDDNEVFQPTSDIYCYNPGSLNIGGLGSTGEIGTGVAINDGKWNLLVFVLNRLTLSVYKNGIFVFSTAVAHNHGTYSGKSFKIGNKGNVGDFSGDIGDFFLYMRALTSSEIRNMYFGASPLILANPASRPHRPMPSADITESLSLSESWDIRINPEREDITENLSLSESWQILSTPETENINESLSLSEEWNITRIEYTNYASKILWYNPLIYITYTNPIKLVIGDITDPENPVINTYTLTGHSNATYAMFNSSNDCLYIACDNGSLLKIDIADPETVTVIATDITNDLLKIASLTSDLRTFVSSDDVDGELLLLDEAEIKNINLDLRWLANIATQISTYVNTINAKSCDLDLRWVAENKESISLDLRWLANTYTAIPTITPNDVQIFVNGVDILLGNDIDIQTGNITHTIGEYSIASFNLARKHDDINRTHLGVASEITNNNSVAIYIKGYLEFSGNVCSLSVDSETETVSIQAQGTQPSDSRHSVSLPLPSVNEQLHMYHCLINKVSIDNPIIDPRVIIIGVNGRFWTGSLWSTKRSEAQIFADEIAAQSYINSYVDLSVGNKFETQQPSVETYDSRNSYYKGVKIHLGEKIQQQVDRLYEIETTISEKGRIATEIEDGTYKILPNYTYFWNVIANNIITGWWMWEPRYIGTSLASTTTDLWTLSGVIPHFQKIKDDIITDLGYYYIGEAPYKEISTKNGILIPAWRWEDRSDGFYSILDSHYNYEDYDKTIANLEYQKLLNIHGDILPITRADINITFDAYYYYNIALLTRINVTNTTVVNTYNNTNGFPTSVKSINIDFRAMTINLVTDNRLSQLELDELDEQRPDEELLLHPDDARIILRKFDLNSWKYVS
jgi:hypothetical protein